ncbi:hypothetical protein ABT095_35370 [Kitasatospora sp. NPDC002227]|uniref:hypothetical protein n=1 Tax=Kitasatospora sp. NPDC002227 TaxID=3154773 RepID=UPI003322285B
MRPIGDHPRFGAACATLLSLPAITEAFAEWTKLRTEAGNSWLLLGAAVLTVAVSAGVTATTRCPALHCGVDAPGSA